MKKDEVQSADLTLDAQHLCKKLGMAVNSCNLSAGDKHTGNSPGFKSDSLSKSVNSRFSERLVGK